MKTLVSATLIITTAAFSYVPSAFGADTAIGAKVFTANCVQCHEGGENVVNHSKSLKQGALDKYNMHSVEDINKHVSKGKNSCPSFRHRLEPDQIENVSAYVLEQADKGWK